MVRLFINVGRSAKVTIRDIIQTISIEAEIPPRSIGRISMYDKFSFVEVPAESAEKVIGVMHRNTIRGYRVNMEPARARE